MSPEAQRIAIAEACGWKWIAWGGSVNLTPIEIQKQYAFAWDHPEHGRVRGTDRLPDYLNDLNAMHEAEKVLTLSQCHVFDKLLRGSERTDVRSTDYPARWMWHATAAQRAEAFLRTVGKWESTP